MQGNPRKSIGFFIPRRGFRIKKKKGIKSLPVEVIFWIPIGFLELYFKQKLPDCRKSGLPHMRRNFKSCLVLTYIITCVQITAQIKVVVTVVVVVFCLSFFLSFFFLSLLV